MADLDLTPEIRELRSTFGDIRHVVDEPKLILEVNELKEQAADPNLWDDPARAQSVTSKLSHKQAMLTRLKGVESRLDDLEVLLEMANAEGDSSAQTEAKAELAGLQSDISELEIQTLLNGEYDSRAAVITIRSGAGGDDATDFAEMLMRMYLMWAEKNGFSVTELDRQDGDVAGVKSVSLEIKGDFAFVCSRHRVGFGFQSMAD